MEAQLAIDLEEGVYCCDCILRPVCGAKDGPCACQPLYGEPRYGGVNVVHPVRHDFEAYFTEIGGAGFDGIIARPEVLPELPPTLPRIYPRRELDGHLHRRFYAVGADEAIISRREVLAADDLREIVGLWSDQRLALILLGKDLHLEQMWPRRHRLAREIAECDYDFVAPPSYSALINHPPSEAIRNLKRSLVFYELLQEHGVPTAPRLAWLSEWDVRRAVSWWEKNDGIQLVVLDLAIKHRVEWQRQLALLRHFDDRTGRQLKYLIHGPQAESRLVDVFSVLGQRLHLSGSRAISKPREVPQDVDRFAAEEESAAYSALLQSSVAVTDESERRWHPDLSYRRVDEGRVAPMSMAA